MQSWRELDAVPKVETRLRDIVARLEREGRREVSGTKHAQFEHVQRPEMLIVVPRHRTLSVGVARSIAKLAGWI
jgi:predicted RNA binding protein YcfA (HicA-like mRNA interferase family)